MTIPRLDALVDEIEQDHPDEPLEQLTAAVLQAARLAALSDHLVGHFVDVARRHGCSWGEVGGSLGVTKQAAQQRFVVKDDLTLLSAFTAKARQAVLHAAREARERGGSEVEPAHLLLGLLDVPESLAARELLSSRKAGQVRAVADSLLADAVPGRGATASPVLSDAAVLVLERAAGQADRLGHGWVGTEHVLLALLASATPGRLARRLGIDRVAAQHRLVAAAEAAAVAAHG